MVEDETLVVRRARLYMQYRTPGLRRLAAAALEKGSVFGGSRIQPTTSSGKIIHRTIQVGRFDRGSPLVGFRGVGASAGRFRGLERVGAPRKTDCCRDTPPPVPLPAAAHAAKDECRGPCRVHTLGSRD